MIKIFIGIPVKEFLPMEKTSTGYDFFMEDGFLFAYGKLVEHYDPGVHLLDMDIFNQRVGRIGKEVYLEFVNKELLTAKVKFPMIFILND